MYFFNLVSLYKLSIAQTKYQIIINAIKTIAVITHWALRFIYF